MSAARAVYVKRPAGRIVRYFEEFPDLSVIGSLVVRHGNVDVAHPRGLGIALFIGLWVVSQVNDRLNPQSLKSLEISLAGLGAAVEMVVHSPEILYPDVRKGVCTGITRSRAYRRSNPDYNGGRQQGRYRYLLCSENCHAHYYVCLKPKLIVLDIPPHSYPA